MAGALLWNNDVKSNLAFHDTTEISLPQLYRLTGNNNKMGMMSGNLGYRRGGTIACGSSGDCSGSFGRGVTNLPVASGTKVSRPNNPSSYLHW